LSRLLYRRDGDSVVYLYRIDGTDVLAQITAYAVVLARRISLPLARRVSGRFEPLKHVDGAVFETRAVGDTRVEVNGDDRTVYPEALGRFDGTPDVVFASVVGVVASDGFAVLVEVGVYGHRKKSHRASLTLVSNHRKIREDIYTFRNVPKNYVLSIIIFPL